MNQLFQSQFDLLQLPVSQLVERRFGQWRRTLAITFWSMTATLSLAVIWMLGNAYIAIDGDEAYEHFQLMSRIYDADYELAKFFCDIGVYLCILAFAVSAFYALRALIVPHRTITHKI